MIDGALNALGDRASTHLPNRPAALQSPQGVLMSPNSNADQSTADGMVPDVASGEVQP